MMCAVIALPSKCYYYLTHVNSNQVEILCILQDSTTFRIATGAVEIIHTFRNPHNTTNDNHACMFNSESLDAKNLYLTTSTLILYKSLRVHACLI